MTRQLTIALLLACLVAGIVIPADAQQRYRRFKHGAAETQATVPLPAGTRVERDLAYGPHPKQRFDVYLPARPQPGAPVLLMVHGGGWRRGDKQSPGVAGNKAAYWLAKGFVFVSVNNRLLPDADPLQQAKDVATALAVVQQQAPGWGADPRRVILMGHSAGAHLVALIGAAPERWLRAGTQHPLGVVALDSAAMNVPEMMARPRLPQIYSNAFGSDPGFWIRASPFHQLTRQHLPMLIVCSSRRPDSCPQGRALEARAATRGVPMQVLPEDLSHAEINRDLGQPSAYTQAVASWIDRLVKQSVATHLAAGA